MTQEEIKIQIAALGFKVHVFVPLKDAVSFQAHNGRKLVKGEPQPTNELALLNLLNKIGV